MNHKNYHKNNHKYRENNYNSICRNRHRTSFAQGCILTVILYFLLAGLLYFAAGSQLYERDARSEITSMPREYASGEFASGYLLRQTFRCDMDTMESFQIYIAAFQRENEGHLMIRLYDDTAGQMLHENSIDISQTVEGQAVISTFPQRFENLRGHMLAIELSSEDGMPGSAAGVWFYSEAEAAQIPEIQMYINEEAVPGVLCFDTQGTDYVWTGPHYWQIILPVGMALLVYCLYLIRQYRLGRKNLVITAVMLLDKYRFLIRQLTARDFKIKYKRSVLGALWSFVNPLLMMSVQYFVFSTIFKADIENYPVYLLAGIVLFNFFNESTNISLYAITGNAGLITKVYVPKYIYPVSKVVSTGVNLMISLLPLLVMCLVTGVPVTKAWLLIPFDLACLLVFCIGWGFILSAVMVFFRDMQFIWSVFSMVLTYATPIFYPETILPDNFKSVLAVNPMYHFIQFFRMIILEGISPEPREYLICALFAAVFCIIGAVVFKKSQDRFIFYI